MRRSTPRRETSRGWRARSNARSRTQPCARGSRPQGPRRAAAVPLGRRRRRDGRGVAEAAGRRIEPRPAAAGRHRRAQAHRLRHRLVRPQSRRVDRAAPGGAGLRVSPLRPGRGPRRAARRFPTTSTLVEEESPGYSISELTRFAWRLLRDRLDLFHATHYVIPPLARARAVVTIHDIIHVLYPQFLPNRFALLYARVMIRRALKRADRILTVSYNTKRDLVDYFGIAPARVEVIYNGVAARFQAGRAPRRARPRRRQVRAAAALPALSRRREAAQERAQRPARLRPRRGASGRCPHALVLAGPMPQEPEPRRGADRGARPRVARVQRPASCRRRTCRGSSPAPTRSSIPTLYEGFGLPVVEAMACGVPVLTSSTSALQEIAGGYAYLVDPMDVDAIARGIVDLATDPARRAEFAELGKRRAARLLVGPRGRADAQGLRRRAGSRKPSRRRPRLAGGVGRGTFRDEDRRRPRLVERHARRREGARGHPARWSPSPRSSRSSTSRAPSRPRSSATPSAPRS